MCNNYCCSLTKEYITCVYSIMALGCALDVANGYMTIVNMSAPVVQAIRGHGCAYGHPLDFLRTSSPVSVVTSVTIRSPQSSFDRPALRSNAHALRSNLSQFYILKIFHVFEEYVRRLFKNFVTFHFMNQFLLLLLH